MPHQTIAERREADLARKHEDSAKGRDIGPIPAVADPVRRERCARDFRAFCAAYFPSTFSLAWSPDHVKVIGQIEQTVLEGGLFATAMPRGSGKTSLVETACLWAVLHGHQSFVALIGSDEGHAGQMLDSLKTELEGNEALAADFPEVCFPIHALEGIAHRCKGQTSEGRRTQIGWTSGRIILPTVRDSIASGAIIKAAGLTGGLRGMKFKRPDGRTVRPGLVVLDDPQTDQSARSPSQCETRERILAGAILGLAGPGRKISGIMPCTVIARGDMADRILDRKIHPEWNGTRTKLVYEFPKAEALWEEYGRIRAASLEAGNAGKEATDFYRAHRAAMDEGAVVAWDVRHNPDELSALQHAMNLRLLDERAFHSEYQNEPLDEREAETEDLTAAQIAAKLNRRRRGEIPQDCGLLTAFIDVQQTLLYWTVCGWRDDFTGYVLDYGTFPDQTASYFTLRTAKKTIAQTVKVSGLEAQLYAALEALSNRLAVREWKREDGLTLKLDRILIDANWGESTETVYLFCRQSAHAAILTPSHGKFFGASSQPMREYRKKPGDRVGLNWRLSGTRGKRTIRHVLFDANYWKSFTFARLAAPMGSPGCLSLFGDAAHVHRLFSDHVTAEFRIRTQGRGREVDEWKQRPGKPDNHFLDCLVGAHVAASLQGATLPAVSSPAMKPDARGRVSFAEIQKRKRMNPHGIAHPQ